MGKISKEELKRIYYLNKEIEMWQKELDKIQGESIIKGQPITGLPFGNTNLTSDHVGEVAATIADIEMIIKAKLIEVQYQRKKILQYIAGIEDSLIRQIIFYRNVSCMSWTEVANHIGGNNTPDSVRVTYHRFLDQK